MIIQLQKISLNRNRHSQSGVSLIELMIALVIAGLIALGLVQIFGASSTTSKMTEGLSRVQENGRFATQFLQRQLRMVGYMGCGADTGRSDQKAFINHMAKFDGTVPDGNQFRFQRQIEGFTAATLPTELSVTGLVANTDGLILRVFSEEGVPVVSAALAATGFTLNLTVGGTTSTILPDAGDKVLMAVENCRTAQVFAAKRAGAVVSALGNTSPNVYLDPSSTVCGSTGCPWDYLAGTLGSATLVGASKFNAEVHRAEYYALFIKTNPAGIPSLYMVRFDRTDTTLAPPEEFVEGVENMQLRYGYDTSTVPDGTVDEYRTAAQVTAGATGNVKDANWQRVLSVRVGLLIRSPERAGGKDHTYKVLGLDVTPAANDGAIREVYETTIALRNRLFNS